MKTALVRLSRVVPTLCVFGFCAALSAQSIAAREPCVAPIVLAPESAPRERTLVGVLISVQTFAQSTGWHLAVRQGFEVDVSAVLPRARRLDGSRVEATGHFEQRRYDHATVRVFVVTSLRRA